MDTRTIKRRDLLAAGTAMMLLGGSRTASHYAVATFRVDVTCPIGHPLLARRQGIAKKIVDPLYAHGLVLIGAGDPIALVAVDWCEIRNDAYHRWREVIASAAGTAPERVLLCSVHQHDAPLADLGAEKLLAEVGMAGETLDVQFFERIGERIAASLRESLRDARPVTHVGLGQAKVEDVASNRRVVLTDGTVTFRRGSNGAGDRFNREAPDGLIDPWLKTISFWHDGDPVAEVSAYATHPMSYYGGGGVSADFVGLAREQRRRQVPAVFQMYVSGCSGDVTAGKYNDGSPANRAILADRLHRGIAAASRAATEHIHPLEHVEFRSRKLDLEFRKGPRYTTEALRQTLENKDAVRKDRVLAAMGLSTRQQLAAGNKVTLPCLDLGPAQIVLFPGESFVGYQLLAQQIHPDSFVMSIGYGECWPGYLPTKSAFEDGFDGHWLWVAPGAEASIEAGLRRVFFP